MKKIKATTIEDLLTKPLEFHFPKLTNDNIELYLALHYVDEGFDAPEEFREDIARIKYIKRLLSTYTQSGSIKTRLISNHLIVMSNVFGVWPANRVLLYKVAPEHHKILTTFLDELNILDPRLAEVAEFDEVVRGLIQDDMNNDED